MLGILLRGSMRHEHQIGVEPVHHVSRPRLASRAIGSATFIDVGAAEPGSRTEMPISRRFWFRPLACRASGGASRGLRAGKAGSA